MNPKDYLPEPDHWKNIFKLPEKIMKAWIKAFRNELVLLIIEKEVFQTSNTKTK